MNITEWLEIRKANTFMKCLLCRMVWN